MLANLERKIRNIAPVRSERFANDANDANDVCAKRSCVRAGCFRSTKRYAVSVALRVIQSLLQSRAALTPFVSPQQPFPALVFPARLSSRRILHSEPSNSGVADLELHCLRRFLLEQISRVLGRFFLFENCGLDDRL